MAVLEKYKFWKTREVVFTIFLFLTQNKHWKKQNCANRLKQH